MFELYGREPTDRRVDLYLELLGEVPPEELARAVKIACREVAEWPPGPGTIYKHVRREYTPHGPGRYLDPDELGKGPTALLDAPAREVPGRLRDLLERAQQIRASGRTVASDWGHVASYILAAEEMEFGEYLRGVGADVRQEALALGLKRGPVGVVK